MRAVIRWALAASTVSALALVLATSVTSASARTIAHGTLAACPSGQGIVSTTVPAYARQGIGVQVGLGVVDPPRVSDASVTLLQGSTVISTTPVTVGAAATRLTLTAPATGTTLTVAVLWNQDAGTSSACTGSDVETVPLIPPYGSAGNPALPRLDGSFALTERPVNYHAAVTHTSWLFNSGCVYFACSAYLQTNDGIDVNLNLRAPGTYQGVTTYNSALAATPCTVGGAHPSTVKNAYTLRAQVIAKVTQSEFDAVTQIAGSLIGTYTPTAAARSHGCLKVRRTIEAFTGQAR